MSRLLPFIGWLLLAFLPALTRAQPGTFFITLKAEKLDVPASPWRVVQVLDARAHRRQLGTVRRGVTNAEGPADFAQPLPAEILRFIQQHQAADTGRPVVLRVLTLAINEDLRANSETGEAELVADFLELQPDSTYRLLLPVGEMLRRGGLDVTGHHAANVAELLQRALRQLAARPPDAATPDIIITRAQALAGQGGAMALRWPAQQGTPAPRGLYRTFADFRNHAPEPGTRVFSITTPERPSKKELATGEVRVEYLDPTADNPRLPVRDVWGASDGEHDFINYQSHFYPVLPASDGRSFTFQGPPVFDAAKATNVALGAVVGGAIGAAVVAGHYSATSPVGSYEVHLATGRVMPAEDFRLDAQGFSVTDSAIVYLYRRPGGAAKEPLNVLLAGRNVATLAPGQYLRLAWTDHKQDLALCLQLPGAAASCQQLQPDFKTAIYLECNVPATSQPATTKPATVKEGAWQVKRLKPWDAN